MNAVLAASARMIAVANAMTRTGRCAPWNTASATCTTTVFCGWPGGKPMRSASDSVTFTWVVRASQVIPANMSIEIAPSRNSVVAAFFDFGLRKAGTPLATASMPVSAVVPEENARATSRASAAPVKEFCATICQFALSARSVWPRSISTAAYPTITKIEAMKKYTGTAKKAPDSLTPRRFSRAMMTIAPTANHTLCFSTNGIVDPRLATPDEIDTATVIR